MEDDLLLLLPLPGVRVRGPASPTGVGAAACCGNCWAGFFFLTAAVPEALLREAEEEEAPPPPPPPLLLPLLPLWFHKTQSAQQTHHRSKQPSWRPPAYCHTVPAAARGPAAGAGAAAARPVGVGRAAARRRGGRRRDVLRADRRVLRAAGGGRGGGRVAEVRPHALLGLGHGGAHHVLVERDLSEGKGGLRGVCE